jgi:hypothetical protein
MAGVIDLKGRVTKKDNKFRKGTQQITLLVETREVKVVKELASLTGTMPEIRERQPLKEWMRRGCVEHCPEQHVHVADERAMPKMGRWTISGGGLAVVLFNLLPFLLSQDEYKEVYDQIMKESPIDGRGSGAVIASIRRLGLIGWDLPEEYSEVEL